MSVGTSERFVLEGSREDIEKFSIDVNAVTNLVLQKTGQSRDDFLTNGLDIKSWDLYTKEMNKVYPTEIDANNNIFNQTTGCFTCNNFLTVNQLNDQLFYTVLKWSSVGIPCSYRELVRKYYPECRYYYYTTIENNGCETNDVNGRYFSIDDGEIYFYDKSFHGWVSGKDYLKIMQNLFHNHSLKLEDVLDSIRNDEESKALSTTEIISKDRAVINGSKDDAAAEDIICPVLDRKKIEENNKMRQEYMAKIENGDYIDYERYPEYEAMSDKFVFGGTAEGKPSGMLYGIKSSACQNGVVTIPEGITEVDKDAFDFSCNLGLEIAKIILPHSFKGELTVRWIPGLPQWRRCDDRTGMMISERRKGY